MNYMNGLGDHLRTGPQYQVPTNTGVQIIQRGPHGKWIAPPLSTGPSSDRRELRWWSEYRQNTLPWVPQQTVVGVAGMGYMGQGGQRRVASDDEKNNLTKLARDLVEKANGLPVAGLSRIVEAAMTNMRTIDGLQTWTESFAPVVLGGYDSSQVVKSNLQAANLAAKARLAGRQAPGGARTPVKDVSVKVEFVKEGVPYILSPITGAPVAYDLAKRQFQEAGRDISAFGKDVADFLRKAAEEAKDTQVKLVVAAVVGLGVVALLYGVGAGAGRGVGQRIAKA